MASHLKDLKSFVEKADAPDLMKVYYIDMVHKLGCDIEEYMDGYLIRAINPLRAKFIELSKKLREMRWYSAAATSSVMLVARSQAQANKWASDYKRGVIEEVINNMRVSSMNLSATENVKGYTEMALSKLTATTQTEQIKELRGLGYEVRQLPKGWNLKKIEDKLAVTPGDIVGVRARMESYANQAWPDTITHFVVKAGPKQMYYSMGISDNMRDAVSSS